MADTQDTGPTTVAVDQPETEQQRAERMAIIEAFALQVKDKRKQAIEGRRSSGIEEIWAEDEEHYEGIDDANRASTKTVIKGRSLTDGPREEKRATPTRSTVFLKITRPYVDAAAARVSDMLLPTDDRNFALRPTPRPELTAMLKDERPAGPDGQPLAPGIAAPAAAPAAPQPAGFMSRLAGAIGFGGGQQPSVPAQPMRTVAQAVQEVLDKAKGAAERAQAQIDDWLTECRYHAEVRRVIEGSAKVGCGILKGPVPVNVRSRAARQTPQGWVVEMREQIRPQSKFVSHWNFYPDPNCGDDIHKGSFTFECDDITGRGLRELKRDPTYLAEVIDQVLEEGPCSVVDGTRQRKQGDAPSDKELFQIWYFHGQVTKAEMEAAGCKCSDPDKELYPAIVTMVNDRVIKVTMSPLDCGEFPYDVMVWQARTDHWAGTGVGRQMRECQKGANAAVRNLMDNAGLSAGPQIIIDRKKIVPANGTWELTPRKIWYSAGGEDAEPLDDVRKAFWIVNIETRQAELMNILQFWLREAEEVTGLPMLLQGQMGVASQTDKVGIANIMNNNGSTVLRRIARNFDDRITEPHIGRYYEFLLIYGPDEAKGDFVIDARGSSALVERDLQAQQLVQIVGLSLNPAYALDPEQVMREFLKSLRFDPKSLELSPERKEELAKRQPPEDPRVTAAKIMAKTREDDIVSKAQIEKMRIDSKAQSDAAERNLKQVLAGIEQRIAMAGISSDERQHLEDMKVQLAKVTLQLRTQTDLAIGAHAVDIEKHRNPAPQVAPAGVEPPQRAPAGEAFQQ